MKSQDGHARLPCRAHLSRRTCWLNFASVQHWNPIGRPRLSLKDALDNGRAQGLKAARTVRQLSVACNLLNEAVGKVEYDQRCLAQVMQYANTLLGKSFAAALSKL